MPDRRALTIVWASLLWLAVSFAHIIKFVPGAASAPPWVVALLSGAAAAIAIGGLSELLHRNAWLRSSRALWLVCAAVVLAFIVVYPAANSGLLGSDRDDALNVALQSLLSGHNPYGAMTYLGHRPTPMPGALLLALPFYLLGNAAYQNLVWIPILAVWLARRSRDAGPAVFYLLVFVCGCPATLADLLAGGDYAVNVFYVAIAMGAVVSAHATGGRARQLAAALVLSVAMSSRPVYVLAAPLLAGAIYREYGWPRALSFLGAVVVACTAINAPFYFADPVFFPTRTLADKIGDLPPAWHLTVVLPILAASIAGAGAWFSAKGPRIFGWMAASLAVLFVPVFLSYWMVNVPDVSLPWLAADALPVALFAGLHIALMLDDRGAKP